MTTPTEAREAVYAEFLTKWGTTTPFAFANDPDFTPPAATTWVRLAVRHDASVQATLGPVGSRRFERRGTISLQIFEPIGGGLDTTDSLVATARGFFEGVTISGVRVFNAVQFEVGVDGDFHQTNLDAEFEYQETR